MSAQFTPTPTMFGTDPEGFMAQFLQEMERGGYIQKREVPSKMWTLKECAKWLDVSEACALDFIEQGMPCVITNPGADRVHRRFHPEAVSEWARVRSMQGKGL